MSTQYICTDAALAAVLIFAGYRCRWAVLDKAWLFEDPGDVSDLVHEYQSEQGLPVSNAKELLSAYTEVNEIEQDRKYVASSFEHRPTDRPTDKEFSTQDYGLAVTLHCFGFEYLYAVIGENGKTRFAFSDEQGLHEAAKKYRSHRLLIEPHSWNQSNFVLMAERRKAKATGT